MNVLFLGLSKFNSYDEFGIYTDLLKKFIDNGHSVYSVVSTERRNGESTHFISESSDANILIVKTLNIQKTNIIEKGLGTMLITSEYKRAIKKYFKGVKFDIILYPTPPITLFGVVKYIKKRDGAKTYLMLKDIFPQNSVDLGMLSTHGLKGFIYRYFRRKEKKLYEVSDKIGCLSPANVEYVLQHNEEIDKNKLEVCPNSTIIRDLRRGEAAKESIRRRYNLPVQKKIFVYGGNLGKPQDVPFIIKCLKETKSIEDAFFLIVGSGTEYSRLNEFVNKEKQDNVKLMKCLPKDEYDHMIASCDVGLIFLDYRFTIPNFPSRVLSYMQAGLPVLSVTDRATDIGQVIEDGNFGWQCGSNDEKAFAEKISQILKSNDLTQRGNNGFAYLENYSSERAYDIIVNSISSLNL